MVQDQINAEESSLEALQSQQRVLAHETTYGTVSVLLVSKPLPPAARPVKLAGGFTGGRAPGRAPPPPGAARAFSRGRAAPALVALPVPCGFPGPPGRAPPGPAPPGPPAPA